MEGKIYRLVKKISFLLLNCLDISQLSNIHALFIYGINKKRENTAHLQHKHTEVLLKRNFKAAHTNMQGKYRARRGEKVGKKNDKQITTTSTIKIPLETWVTLKSYATQSSTNIQWILQKYKNKVQEKNWSNSNDCKSMESATARVCVLCAICSWNKSKVCVFHCR